MPYMKSSPIHMLLCSSVLLLFSQCKDIQNNNNTNTADTTSTGKQREEKKQDEFEPSPERIAITYRPQIGRDSAAKVLKANYSPEQRKTILAINRIDAGHIRGIDTLLIPDTFVTDFNQYSPFPADMPKLKDVKKIIFFSYPTQAWGVYEMGRLKRWGPSSMGKGKTRTPTGLFFTNWKAEETVSTVDDEWILKWNFNISNLGGIGWHQYAMPGYPASHSCLRVLEEDAKYLYTWADQWVLKNDRVVVKGTPTVVYGTYPFGGQRPWLKMLGDPKALEITTEMLEKEVEGFLPDIMAAQQERDEYNASKAETPPATASATQ